MIWPTYDVQIGIHCHNDGELAVANSLAAVDAGATQVQGTINGIGERCGNVDLISVIANLALKKKVYSVLGGRPLHTADRTESLCLRNSESAVAQRPAVRRSKCLRPQRRHARARDQQSVQDLRTHRSGTGR